MFTALMPLHHAAAVPVQIASTVAAASQLAAQSSPHRIGASEPCHPPSTWAIAELFSRQCKFDA